MKTIILKYNLQCMFMKTLLYKIYISKDRFGNLLEISETKSNMVLVFVQSIIVLFCENIFKYILL